MMLVLSQGVMILSSEMAQDLDLRNLESMGTSWFP